MQCMFSHFLQEKSKTKYSETYAILLLNKDYTNDYHNNHTPSACGIYMSNFFPFVTLLAKIKDKKIWQNVSFFYCKNKKNGNVKIPLSRSRKAF